MGKAMNSLTSVSKFSLSEYDVARYSRQLTISGFTAEYQAALGNATVFAGGVGGLGGTAALYLAAAGVGRLVLAHYGSLDLPDLNRQILMKDRLQGVSRLVQAKQAILDLNPHVDIELHDTRITGENAETLIQDADIVLSARPNFPERRALNAACVARRIPMVEGAMNSLEGYLFNVIPCLTPCLSCIYPIDNPVWEELGFPVLGAVSGLLGCVMAIEAIKLITGFAEPLTSRMLLFDGRSMDFQKIKIKRRDDCAICGGVL